MRKKFLLSMENHLHFIGESVIMKTVQGSPVNLVPGGEIIMAYKITDACLSCGSCADACPVEAIKEGDSTYVIDADTCISCGSCADTCPVQAIVED